MVYKVIRPFFDLQDKVEVKGGTIYHEYKVGDVYPRAGHKPEKGRIEEICSSDNAQGSPLIASEKVADATQRLEAAAAKASARKKSRTKAAEVGKE